MLTTSQKVSTLINQNLIDQSNLHQDILEYVDANACLIKTKTK
jgi:hypothetical protein